MSQVFLFLMIFHIPCDNGERMGFGVTILLSITVYLLVISEKLPEKSDDRPMLGICFIIEFYVLSLALVFAAIIVKLSSKTNRPPNYLIRFCGACKAMRCGNVNKKLKGKKRRNNVQRIEMREANRYLQNEEKVIDTSHVTEDEEEDEEEINRQLWKKICDSLDQTCFYLFGFVTIFAPIVVVAFLNHKMLGV